MYGEFYFDVYCFTSQTGIPNLKSINYEEIFPRETIFIVKNFAYILAYISKWGNNFEKQSYNCNTPYWVIGMGTSWDLIGWSNETAVKQLLDITHTVYFLLWTKCWTEIPLLMRKKHCKCLKTYWEMFFWFEKHILKSRKYWKILLKTRFIQLRKIFLSTSVRQFILI